MTECSPSKIMFSLLIWIPPPPHTHTHIQMHKGADVSRRFREKARDRGCFIVLPVVAANTRDRGVKLMGNEHRVPPNSMGMREGVGRGAWI